MKKVKSIGIHVLAFLLAVILVSGTFGISAHAEKRMYDQDPKSLFNGMVITQVELGGDFEIPVASDADKVQVTVLAPNGEVVTPVNRKVRAEQLGNYTVKFIDTLSDQTSYSYNVFCSMTKEYELEVEHNGATIPTYMKGGESFEIPNVELVHYNEDGERQPQENTKGDDWVVVQGAGTLSEDKKTVTAGANGTILVKFTLKLGTAENKHYFKEYKVLVQENFVDEVAPTLNVVNVPATANINVKTTLPVATATDNFDENVKIEVQVRHNALRGEGNPEGNAVEVEVDPDTGYATSKKTSLVVFDNIKNMSFYPTELGTYTVSYVAIDDSGSKSNVHEYRIECADRQAPIFTDLDKSMIPNVWGRKSVINEEGSRGNVKFKFPLPMVKDNADDFMKNTVTVSFRIIDPESRTVLNFTNIMHAYDEMEGTGPFNGNKARNKSYDQDAEQTFGRDGFEFDFSKYEHDNTGNYSVQYRARDSKGNTKTETVEINVENNFEDRKAPSIDEIDTVKYILIGENGDKTLTIPEVVVSDDKDTDPQVFYSIKFGQVSKEVDGGEELRIEKDDETNKYFLRGDEDFSLEIAEGNIDLSCYAIDSAGNTSDTVVQTIAVYFTENKQQTLTLAHDLKTSADRTGLDENGVLNYVPVNLGDFKITGVSDERFSGFEVLIKDSEDRVAEFTLERMIVSNDIYVKNLTFNPRIKGDYSIYIRTFDISGNSKLYVHIVNITGEIKGKPPSGSSIVMPNANGKINQRYALDFNSEDFNEDHYQIVRISGKHFSVMGNDFIAHEIGSYRFSYNNILKTKTDDQNDYAYSTDDMIFWKNGNMSVTDKETPTIEVLGVMPTYSERHAIDISDLMEQDPNDGRWVLLPSVAAYTATANATLEIDVRDGDDNIETAYEVYYYMDGNTKVYTFKKTRDVSGVETENIFANQWAFVPQDHGNYKVTYTASVNAGGEDSVTHNILVGDIVAPTFEVQKTNLNALKKVVGQKFKFDIIENTKGDENDNDRINYFTYTKRLIYANNEIAKISGRDTGSTKTSTKVTTDSDIIIDKSGTYTVEYTVTDENGNTSMQKFTFTVAPKSTGTSSSMRLLSTVLIIATVFILIGVLFYVIRFRKVKR